MIDRFEGRQMARADDPQGAETPPDLEFELVRPYVAQLGPAAPKHRRSSRAGSPDVEPQTLLLPRQTTPYLAGDIAGPRSGRRGGSRYRLMLAAAIAVVVAVVTLIVTNVAQSNDRSPNLTTRQPPAAPIIPTYQRKSSNPARASTAPVPAGIRSTGVSSRTSRARQPTASALRSASFGPHAPPPVASAPPPTVDLAGGAPIVDSGHTDIYVAAHAVDGSPTTYWESTDNAFPQSITVDLGSEVPVGRIVLSVPPMSSWNTRTQTLSISGSADGGQFNQLVGTAGYTFDPSHGNTAKVAFSPSSARFVRLTFTANTVWPAGQLSELKIYSGSS
jgi:hypothetical protein